MRLQQDFATPFGTWSILIRVNDLVVLSTYSPHEASFHFLE